MRDDQEVSKALLRLKWITVLGIIAVIAMFIYSGYYIPNKEEFKRQAEAAAKEAELLKSAGVSSWDEFNKLPAEERFKRKINLIDH